MGVGGPGPEVVRGQLSHDGHKALPGGSRRLLLTDIVCASCRGIEPALISLKGRGSHQKSNRTFNLVLALGIEPRLIGYQPIIQTTILYEQWGV